VFAFRMFIFTALRGYISLFVCPVAYFVTARHNKYNSDCQNTWIDCTKGICSVRSTCIRLCVQFLTCLSVCEEMLMISGNLLSLLWFRCSAFRNLLSMKSDKTN